MREAKIVSVGLPLPGGSDDPVGNQLSRIEKVLSFLDAYRPDFVCFPEICLHVGPIDKGFGACVALAESVPGPSTERISPYCRKLDTHICLPLLEEDDDRVYNTVVLLGPDGEIIGRYRKHCPTSCETDDGVTPGSDIDVWQTAHGRVGCAVCFDLKFPEVGLALSRGHAEIVFWPSMFQGGTRLTSWARDYGFFIVSCGCWGGRIIDPGGHSVADLQFPTNIPDIGPVNLVQSTCNLDCKTYHLDNNRDKLPDLLHKYGSGVEVFLMDDEGIFTLTSLMQDRSVEHIEKEFELEDLRHYLDRAAETRCDLLSVRQ